ncbi:acetamidase/formamidase [Purpureocillium lavendulum]|uniref:Acetamidase/formamidase n=1 Tax=Purpureocillium lavendulum TaxID=1247861 RepID=A0AB34FZ70_9HYPO|nr:acetamidase/formamidase [Purpureocillium lavendulum]
MLLTEHPDAEPVCDPFSGQHTDDLLNSYHGLLQAMASPTRGTPPVRRRHLASSLPLRNEPPPALVMACVKISRKQRLIATIVISFSFFVAELIAGFYTHSLALVADAFHYLSDLVGFVVALVAVVVSERAEPPPKEYTFGWQRATLLGAFFNGVFLLALGVTILVQAIERFSHIAHTEEEAAIYIADYKSGVQTSASHHEHKHTTVRPSRPGRDLGMLGVLIHVIGDAINNIGVIISAVVIWKAKGEGRYYIDPAISVFIAFMIFLTAIPLTKTSGSILLQIAPGDIDLEDVKHDIESIPGVDSVHELHIWRLDQHKSVASAHVVVDDRTIKNFAGKARCYLHTRLRELLELPLDRQAE